MLGVAEPSMGKKEKEPKRLVTLLGTGQREAGDRNKPLIAKACGVGHTSTGQAKVGCG